MNQKAKKLRCAVYTRKSTDEGLEQDFNSLDAQRDAGEAYIKSQQHEGWNLINTAYDDGGYSGGNLKRPALEKLIDDVKQKKVDVIVVYKVDRLSRSLHDFSKLVEIFDKYGVSFVSVTQAFNTTNSMGRLTLNILLSFAQFEREVTGERIRDKIKASKKKGIWMGGRLVLGYDVKHRQLIINDKEASHVRTIYDLYLKLNSRDKILKELNNRNIKNKLWVTEKGKQVGGAPFTKTTLYGLLKNPIYIGKVKHKDNIYDGEHKAIIEQDIWDRVQEKLKKRAVNSEGRKNRTKPFLLRGKIFDPIGNKFSTSYTTKIKNGQKQFTRYYIIKSDAINGYTHGELKSLNADEIEQVARILLMETVKDTPHLYKQWHGLMPTYRNKVIKDTLIRLDVSKTQIKAHFDTAKIKRIKSAFKNQKIGFVDNVQQKKQKTKSINVDVADKTTTCTFDYIYKTYGGKKLITDADGYEISITKSNKSSNLINALVTAHQCHQHLKKGTITTVKDLALKMKRDRSYISKIIKLYYLSPKIKASILDGKQPRTITVQSLLKISDTIDWKKQETMFGA